MTNTLFYEATIHGQYLNDQNETKKISFKIVPQLIGNGSDYIGFNKNALKEAMKELSLSDREKESLIDDIKTNYATTYSGFYYGLADHLQQYVKIPVSDEVIQ